MNRVPDRRLLAYALLSCIGLGSSLLSGCLPVAATAFGLGAFSAIDRRTLGAQIEDQSIQARGNQRLREVLPGSETAYATVNSYNRRVLLVGQAPDEATKQKAADLVGTLGNVRLIDNEIRIGTGTISALKDTELTARVKTALVELKDFNFNAVKVTTENTVVYLMGLVTEKEGERAAAAASKVSGVSRVVTLYDIISEQELADIEGRKPDTKAPADATSSGGSASGAAAGTAAPATASPGDSTPTK